MQKKLIDNIDKRCLSNKCRFLRQINGIIDQNDLDFVIQKWGNPIIVQPAPFQKRTGTKPNPHLSRFFYRDGKVIDIFHIKPIYYWSVDKKWRPLTEITSYFGNKRGMVLLPGWEGKINFNYLTWYMKRQNLLKGLGIRLEYPITFNKIEIDQLRMPLVLNPTDTFFPDPDVETTSVDGSASRTDAAACEVWANRRGGTGNLGTDNAASDWCGYLSSNQGGGCASPNWNFMGRGIFLFDTSAIADNATISSATFSIFGVSKVDGFSQTIDIVLSTVASNTAVVAADYEGTVNNTTLQSDNQMTIPNYSTTAYNDFALNATGLNNISLTGITKLGTKLSGDRSNTEPTWASARANVYCNYAEAAGTANDPKLAVTYTTPVAGGAGSLLLLGIGN